MDYLTLDDPAILASALHDPHGLIRSLATKKVVLDEFQYAPGLIPAIKEASAKAQEALPGHMARLDFLSVGDYSTDDYRSKIQALVPYLAGLCGNLLKYAGVGNDLGLDDRVVKAYIEILDLMFIVRRVPSWLKSRSRREASQMPKLHFVDNRKNEVDMVLEKSNGRIIGIEIKASASVKIQDFNGLVKLAEYAEDRFEQGVLFYSGNAILPFKIGAANFHALPSGLIRELHARRFFNNC